MMVYLMGVPGGWIADRFLGHTERCSSAESSNACGHFTMAISGIPFFYTAYLDRARHRSSQTNVSTSSERCTRR